MAKKDSNTTPRILKPAFIITLIFGLLLGIFALFNQQEALCNITGFQVKGRSMAYFAFWSFLAGALYAWIIAGLYIFKLKAANGALKRELKAQ